jgi:pimeloyl-ACP methyl ester carboxylesterase
VPGRRIPWPHDRYSGLSFRDHVLAVPLDNDDPGGVTIELFAREVVAPERAGDDLPWLLFLQGGPGGKAPRPTAADGWLGRALRTHRVLLLDQRGTGRSSPVTARTVAGMAPGQLAAHLRLFRADSIVADAEIARARIAGGARWDTLGQSYGGFITLAYLSRAPEGLRTCYVTGGLPGMKATVDDWYARTYPRVAARNAEYYRAYPGDAAAVRRLADHLDDNEIFALQEFTCSADGSATGWAAERALARHPEFAADADPLLFTGEMMYPWMSGDAASHHLRTSPVDSPQAGAAGVRSTSLWNCTGGRSRSSTARRSRRRAGRTHTATP